MHVGGLGLGNYSTIEEGLFYTPPGGWIIIHPGNYEEHLLIDKTINISAETPGSVTIDGDGWGTIMEVTAPSVNITGLSFTNAGSHWKQDYGLSIQADNCRIVESSFTDNICGLYINSENNYIGGNTFTNDGIYLNSSTNTLSANVVNNRPITYLYNTTGSVIDQSRLSGQIILDHCSNIRVANQSITDTTIPIHLIDSDDCHIFNNTLEDNTCGIWLLEGSTNNTVELNEVQETGCTLTIDASSTNNLIFHNNFRDESLTTYDYSGSTIYSSAGEGNYWASYDEIVEGAYDNDSNGIIDSSYAIPVTSATDPYPLHYPFGSIYNYDTQIRYRTIQQAIDDASTGDTIELLRGIYHERIIIDKTIHLRGLNRQETVLDGEGVGIVVSVSASNTTLEELTITNGGSLIGDSGIYASGSRLRIVDSVISENHGDGIVGTGNHLTLINTVVGGNLGCGVYLQGSLNCSITDSFIQGNADNAIRAENVTNLKIASTLVNENLKTTLLSGCSGGQILDCTFSNNDDAALTLQGNTSGLSILESDFSENFRAAIHLNGAASITISDNHLFGNANGVKADSASYTTISYNMIRNNDNGVYFGPSTDGNYVYHNRFSSNIYSQAIDVGNNNWDDGYPSGGNYWGDYSTNDTLRGINQNQPYSDGIYDFPYVVLGGANNQDNYPLSRPWGENRPVAVINYVSNSYLIELDGNSSYDRDGEIVQYTWNFGDGDSDVGENVLHRYTQNGSFTIRLTVRDDNGFSGFVEVEYVINEEDPPENYPPIKPPQPDGTISGRFNSLYNYSASTTDPDGDDIYYMFSWGDGTYSDWLGPYESGSTATASHSFSKGYYDIRVKAKDTEGNETDWSDPLPISMPRGRNLFEDFYVFIVELLQRMFPFLFSLN